MEFTIELEDGAHVIETARSCDLIDGWLIVTDWWPVTLDGRPLIIEESRQLKSRLSQEEIERIWVRIQGELDS